MSTVYYVNRKIQLTLFDIFAFVLPGAIVILSIWIIGDGSLIYVQDVVDSLLKINTNETFVGGVIAYIVGFIINSFGYELHEKVGLKIWRIPATIIAEGQKNSQKNVLIREFSPNNLIYLEKWLSYRAFAHNLAFAFLVLGFSLLTKLLIYKPPVIWTWISLSIVVITSIFPLLYRAHLYQKIYYWDLSNTVKELRLEKKVTSEAEMKSEKS